MKRVGYWLSEKKTRKLITPEFIQLCKEANIDLVKLNLCESLEQQGPFALILHKLTDQIVKADQGDSAATAQISSFHEFTKRHPEVVILDPLENLYKLLDRHVQYKFVQECDIVEEGCHFFTPPFVEFTEKDPQVNRALLLQNGVQFPFVCKPKVAHGSRFCHEMCIIFNEEGLKSIQPPCVAQTFINHNALLYKIFVIGHHNVIVERPSIKNFSAGDLKTIYFDSHDVSKADSSSFLNELDASEVGRPLLRPDITKLHQFATHMRQRLRLQLFGLDVIVENETGRYAVIDINAFPGYDGVVNFSELLVGFVSDVLQRSSSGRDEAPLCKTPLCTTPLDKSPLCKAPLDGRRNGTQAPLHIYTDATAAALRDTPLSLRGSDSAELKHRCAVHRTSEPQL